VKVAVFAEVVKFDYDRLKQGMVSGKGLFFFTIPKSTINPQAAHPNKPSFLIISVVPNRQKCHFCQQKW